MSQVPVGTCPAAAAAPRPLRPGPPLGTAIALRSGPVSHHLQQPAAMLSAAACSTPGDITACSPPSRHRGLQPGTSWKGAPGRRLARSCQVANRTFRGVRSPEGLDRPLGPAARGLSSPPGSRAEGFLPALPSPAQPGLHLARPRALRRALGGRPPAQPLS